MPQHPSQELLNSLQTCKLIGIHGPQFSGKSALAKELSLLLNGTHIEVDKIPGPIEGDKYLDHIDFSYLKSKIQNSDKLPIIIDCVLLLDVLEKINIMVDELLLCERENHQCFSLGLKLEADYENYQKRHNPRTTAKQVFILYFSI